MKLRCGLVIIFASVLAGGCKPSGPEKSSVQAKSTTDTASAESYLNRGMSFQEKQNYSKAVEAYSEALRFNPKLTA